MPRAKTPDKLTPEQERIKLENAVSLMAEELSRLPPEKHAAWFADKAKDPEAARFLVKFALAKAAREGDSPISFAKFYELIHGNRLPKHCMKWIEGEYKAHEEGVGFLLWCWRGSWKSTVVSVTFQAYRIGKMPGGTCLQVNANDDSADKITASIANMIESNPYWQMVFPHIVPWKERGWGAEGYWVRDDSVKLEDWARQQSSVIDPTFVGGGVGSGRLIGKHPSIMLNFDDIHDEKNSTSVRQREEIIKLVSETLLPTAIKDAEGKWTTWVSSEATPWTEDDVNHWLLGTGQFNHINMPVMSKAYEDDSEAVFIDGRNRNGVVFSDITGHWKLTWAERFGVNAIIADRARYGKRGFARMDMLDLAAAKEGGLKYYTYPHENIDTVHWQMGAGCDFAEVLKESQVVDPGRDFFSMAVGAKTPVGKIVVVDGVLEQCTQAQAEVHLGNPQNLYRNWKYTLIEGNGKGETFYVALKLRNPGVKVIMQKLGTRRSKADRLAMEMGPWLENGAVMVSDADTPYLNALKKALDDFPNGNMDILDGLYWLCKVFPETMVVPDAQDELPRYERSKVMVNPLHAFGRKSI